MIFVAAIDTPHLTKSIAPKVTTIPIIQGTITRLIIFFPPGVNALAHLKLLWGNYQLFPSNQQGDFAGGDVLLDWDEDIAIDAAPLQITAQTWNDDDTYDHTITVHVVMNTTLPAPSASTVIAAVMAANPPAPAATP